MVLNEYKEHKFTSIQSANLDLLTEEEKTQFEEKKNESKSLLDSLKEALKDKVEDVRLSNHQIFKKLEEVSQNNPDKINMYASILYNQALFMKGIPLEDPAGFANPLNELMLEA